MVASIGLRAAPPPVAVHTINRVLEAATRQRRLVGGPDGFRWVELGGGRLPLTALAPIAEATGRLLVEADPRRIRRCEGSGCGLWFLDTSRGGRRRWCSMATCGNRAKVARHSRRAKRAEALAAAGA